MILNRLEFLLTNNPLRALLQRHIESKRFHSLGTSVPCGTALEVGCGRGVGVEIILDAFGANQVDAFDLDPRMVRRARRRLRRRKDETRLWVGDVTHIASASDRYDSVFDFAIIHHVLHWRDALAEIHRVLRPGGRFYADEVLARALHWPLVRRIFEHPVEDRFEAPEFCDALRCQGFEIIGSSTLCDIFIWVVAEKRPRVVHGHGSPE